MFWIKIMRTMIELANGHVDADQTSRRLNRTIIRMKPHKKTVILVNHVQPDLSLGPPKHALELRNY